MPGFRLHEHPDYEKRRNRFIASVADYYETEEASTSLEEMMLAAYSLAEFVRKEGSFHLKRDTRISNKVVPIDEAIQDCVDIIDAPPEDGIPYYREAEVLETLSRNCFRRLKKIRPDLIKTHLGSNNESNHEGL